MIQLARRSYSVVQKSSTLSVPVDGENSWKWLLETAGKYQPSVEELNVVNNHRPWANAPSIAVEFDNKQKNAFIHWFSDPSRNIAIQLLPDYNMYTGEVHAIYYGAVLAESLGEKFINIHSSNEVVVRVGNGKYRAAKEKELFTKIQKCILEETAGFKMRLSLMNNKLLEDLKLTENTKKELYSTFPSIPELEFRDVHYSSIIRI